MSSIGGPNINDDGLILSIDASNPICYNGEPTTNLLSKKDFNLWSKTNVDINLIDNYLWFENRESYFVKPNTTNAMHRVYVSDGAYIETGSTYTFSIYAKSIGCKFISFGASDSVNYQALTTFNLFDGSSYLNFSAYGGSVISSKSTKLKNGWFRFELTLSLNSFNNTNYFMILISNTFLNPPYTSWSGNGIDGIYISSPQVEKNIYSTPFVFGSRGSTVETGGGLIDLSRNNNNLSVIKKVNLVNDNLGAFVFSGTTFNGIFKSNLNPNEFTCTIWFDVISGYLIRRYSYGWGIYVSSSNVLTAWVDVDVNHRVLSRTIPFSGITSVTLSFGNYQIKIYKNGELIHDVKTTSSQIYSSGVLNIGADNDSVGLLNGKIFNLKLYDRVLNEYEVLNNYNSLKSKFK